MLLYLLFKFLLYRLFIFFLLNVSLPSFLKLKFMINFGKRELSINKEKKYIFYKYT